MSGICDILYLRDSENSYGWDWFEYLDEGNGEVDVDNIGVN